VDLRTLKNLLFSINRNGSTGLGVDWVFWVFCVVLQGLVGFNRACGLGILNLLGFQASRQLL